MANLKFAALGTAAVLTAFLGFAAYAPASAESVAKECGADWKAAKAAGTTNGQSWAEFYKSCKAQKAAGGAAPAAAATPAAAPAPAATPMAAPAPVATPAAVVKPKPMAKPQVAATGAGQFASEAEAKGHCPTDIVVWLNTKSHKYHYAGHRSYGTTKQGAYMCEADAKAAGDLAAKGEKPK